MISNTSRVSDPSHCAAPPASTLRPGVTDAITRAVLDELAHVGYGKLTMEGVARRARSSKPTIYRRWPSKEAMVLDALASVSRPAIPDVDTADLREHLRQLVRSIHVWLSDPLMMRIFPDMLAEGLRSDVLDRALTHHIAEPRRSAMRTVMSRAVERGEITDEANVEVALDLLGAPIYWRLCVLRREVNDAYLEDVVDIVHRKLVAGRSRA